MTQLYLQLTRNRTNEVIIVNLEQGLKVIDAYHQKQKFMNMLGQEEFWKKNRLVLWKELNALKIPANTLTLEQKATDTIVTDFVNTDFMLSAIKYKLADYFADQFRKREQSLLEDSELLKNSEHWDYTNNYGRYKASRVRKIYMTPFEIRHSDLQAFNTEMQALFKKYRVKDHTKLRSGKRYFDFDEAARRLVSLYYK